MAYKSKSRPSMQEPANMRGGKPHSTPGTAGRVHDSKVVGGGKPDKGVNRRTGSASRKA